MLDFIRELFEQLGLAAIATARSFTYVALYDEASGGELIGYVDLGGIYLGDGEQLSIDFTSDDCIFTLS